MRLKLPSPSPLFEIFVIVLAIVSVSYLILSVSKYGSYSYHFNTFDAGIRLVSHNYFDGGLLPYREVGIIYPPGMLFLINSLANFSETITVRNNISEYLFYIFILILLPILYYLSGSKKSLFLLSVSYFSLLCLLIVPYIQYEFAWILLFLLCVFCICIYIKTQKKILLLSISILSLLVVFLRWDMILNHIILLLLLTLINKFINTDEFTKLIHVLISQALGFFAGVLLLVIYLNNHDMLYEGYEFLVKIPLFVIHRELATNWLSNDSIPFWVFSASSIYFVWYFRAHSSSKLFMYSRMFFLFLLPYTLGRGDVNEHAMREILFFFGISLLLSFNEIKKKSIQLMILMSIPLFIYSVWLFDEVVISRPPKNTALTHLYQELSECKRYASHNKYETIFVGRTNYAVHDQNVVILYMIDKNIKPATRFISDENGMQNECSYNRIIADELSHAKKPMIAYLEVNDLGPRMGCDNLRIFLETAPYKDLGTCNTYEKKFFVREYY